MGKDTDRFTLWTTKTRLDKIKTFVSNPDTISNFINKAIDHELHNLETRYMSDFIYYLGFPTLAFLGMVFLSLSYLNLFFYIITVIIGIYIVVLFFLFYNKYHKKEEKK